MNSLQKLYEQGRQEGLHLGVALGLRRGLEGRFGPLTAEQAAHLDRLDDAGLEAAFQRLFTANSVEAVIG